MARTLPWLKSGHEGASTKPKSSTSKTLTERLPKRRRLSTPQGSDLGLDLNTTGVLTPERKSRFLKSKTPSTSPPPAPPEQEPMRGGYAADDIWIMVEDEFLSTAQLFTQHLHHAEYQRLKRLAKAREASSISQPLEARTITAAQPKAAIEPMERKPPLPTPRKRLAGEQEDDLEDDEPWLQDPHLAGLMESPRKPAQLLRSQGKGRANTNTAAAQPKGARQPSNPDLSARQTRKDQDEVWKHKPGEKAVSKIDALDDSDDDLDVVVSSRPGQGKSRMESPIRSKKERLSSRAGTRIAGFPAISVPKGKMPREPTEPASERKIALEQTKGALPVFEEDILPSRRTEAAEQTDLMARRKAKAARRERDERRRSSTTTEIPTFLF